MPKRVVELRKWGHSRAMIVPKDILAQLQLNVGDMLVVSVERDVDLIDLRKLSAQLRGEAAA